MKITSKIGTILQNVGKVGAFQKEIHMNKRLFTSESVTEGHPDKVCDKISDSVLDAILAQDKMARVACETCCNTGFVMVMGEITNHCNQ